ncbi:hypothetical protein E4H04_13515 [Candidatus Bathyarchaeota archaeon]|nr:MAG: hypothetical protein E4H04_13515 [Candidatus Bathyarchaeota archaeon]
MNYPKDLLMQSLEKYQNIFSKTLQDLLKNDRYYIQNVIEFHELVGLFECLIDNELLIKEKISTSVNDAIIEYRTPELNKTNSLWWRQMHLDLLDKM